MYDGNILGILIHNREGHLPVSQFSCGVLVAINIEGGSIIITGHFSWIVIPINRPFFSSLPNRSKKSLQAVDFETLWRTSFFHPTFFCYHVFRTHYNSGYPLRGLSLTNFLGRARILDPIFFRDAYVFKQRAVQ